MSTSQNISASRRKFLATGVNLTVFSMMLVPFQKVLGSGVTVMTKSIGKLQKFFPIDKLVLNTKTGVVHLPIGRIFSKYPTIRHQVVFGTATWEAEVRPPYHFHKEKSGIILETLALTRLADGINDRSLTDAYRILSIAYTNTYKNKSGLVINKYNFRLHHLLLQVIALNNTVPSIQKWEKFHLATGKINYGIADIRPLPKFMNWLKSKSDFDKKVNYILSNKSTYTTRLSERASRVKL